MEEEARKFENPQYIKSEFPLWDGRPGEMGSVFSYALSWQIVRELKEHSRFCRGRISRRDWINIFRASLRCALEDITCQNSEEIAKMTAFEALSAIYTACEDISSNTMSFMFPRFKDTFESPTLEEWLEHCWGKSVKGNKGQFKLDDHCDFVV